MANDQNEIGLPTPDNNDRTSLTFLPRFFRTEANNKFLQATIALCQLINPKLSDTSNPLIDFLSSSNMCFVIVKWLNS